MISRHYQLARFGWEDEKQLQQEELRATKLLKGLISDAEMPTFIWSYETYILFGKCYLVLLAGFLEIPHRDFDDTEPHPMKTKSI